MITIYRRCINGQLYEIAGISSQEKTKEMRNLCHQHYVQQHSIFEGKTYFWIFCVVWFVKIFLKLTQQTFSNLKY